MRTARLKLLQIDQTGSVVFPAKFFVEIIRKLPAEQIEIEVNEQFPNDYSFRFFRNSNGMDLDPEEYPCSS